MNYSSSLKEYLEFYSQFGIDEISIVEKYISDKHLESEFSDMVIRLTADNLRKEKERISRAISVSEVIGCSHLDSYTEEENKFLDKLTRNLAFYPETCLSYYEKEIKEKIPNMLMPDICYINLIALINYNTLCLLFS